MILTAKELEHMKEFQGMSPDDIETKLRAIEDMIRSYTNNNFQVRSMRIESPVAMGLVCGKSPYFRPGDTLQISQSGVNDGLYVIMEIREDGMLLDGELYDCPNVVVTKVVYPADVKKGVTDLMIWEKENRQKVGIKTESLSRHSVTYYDQDANNQVMGYPISLLGFLKPYMKARF